MGFPNPPGQTTFYTPNDLPDDGTQTLSNGDGTVTAPPSGTVFTWHQSATTYTVSARGYQGDHSDGGGDGNGGIVTGTFTGSGDGPVQTIGESGGGRGEVSLVLAGVGTMLGVLFL